MSSETAESPSCFQFARNDRVKQGNCRMTGKRRLADKSNQRARFAEAAHKIGADEDEVAFCAKLAVIARQKPGAHSLGGNAFH